ncbi:MAG: DNA-processing protein DprA, partial [Bariatricus sp.]|nr:DNA-processing protein DprA [Bariatricus sp.]
IVLYYKGHFRNIKDPVAIVGARRCMQQDKFQAVELAEQYARNGETVISGMAKGIDSYAHTACLKANGYTIAIVGNGLDICYPSEHKKLMDCIIEKGMLLSEYPPGIRPSKYTFPRRNRLISAWADHIIVIAPGRGSGALITAEYGRKYGRKVEIVSKTHRE